MPTRVYFSNDYWNHSYRSITMPFRQSFTFQTLWSRTMAFSYASVRRPARLSATELDSSQGSLHSIPFHSESDLALCDRFLAQLPARTGGGMRVPNVVSRLPTDRRLPITIPTRGAATRIYLTSISAYSTLSTATTTSVSTASPF